MNNQGEFNRYHKHFSSAWDFNVENGVRNVRNTVFWAKFYPWLAAINSVRCIPSLDSVLGNDFNIFSPGLEVKYAIEEALQHNSQIHYGGLAIDGSDLQSLKVETRISPFSVLYQHLRLATFGHYSREIRDFRNL